MLGLTALGIEQNEWACATSTAAGHECVCEDLAALDPRSLGPVWGLIGSPPCQAYSSAGKGLGRQDKPLVIACAHELAAGNDSRADRLAQCAYKRSLLTVEPLRYALTLRPRWIALEREAEEAGIRWCRWGGYDLKGERAGEASRERPGQLCESCEARQHQPSRAGAGRGRSCRGSRR